MQTLDDFQNNMQQSYVWGATGIITSEVDERRLSSLFLFATGLMACRCLAEVVFS